MFLIKELEEKGFLSDKRAFRALPQSLPAERETLLADEKVFLSDEKAPRSEGKAFMLVELCKKMDKIDEILEGGRKKFRDYRFSGSAGFCENSNCRFVVA